MRRGDGALESIEGRRGVPRLRPPYPAQSGLFGRPTLINNVETFANLPWIIRHGAAAFAQYGTAKSKGTKVFALAGKTVRGGLIEVPMGITIRRVVEDIGGGIAGGRRFKAVLIGGPSGGCLPESLADTLIDYESLVERARSWVPAACSCSMKATAWWTSLSIFSVSVSTSPAGGYLLLRRHATAARHPRTAHGRRRRGGRLGGTRNGSAAWSSRPASAASARRPPTR